MHNGRVSFAEERDPQRRRSFGALRHRDFQLFWGGSVLSHVAAWMAQVAQSWLLYQLTDSAFLVGVNGLFHAVPFILISLYAGTVVDRVDRKKLLLWIEGWNTAIVFIIGFLIATDQIQVWHIYASSVVHSLAGGFESPARNSLLPHLIPRSDLMTAVSLNSTVRKGAQIIGPALGGIFVATFGVAGTYFIHAGGNVVLMACLFAMRATNPPPQRQDPPIRAMMEGLRYVRAEAFIGMLLIMEGAMSIFGSYQAMMVIFARDVFEAGPQGLGMLQSAAGAGSVAGSFVLALAGDVHHKGRLLIVGGVAYGVALIAFAHCPWFGAALPILAAVGAMDIVFSATRTTLLQLLTPSEMLGRVMSLAGISMRGLGNLGTFQTGAVASVVGVHWALTLGAVLCILVTLGAGWRVPQVRQFTGTGLRPLTADSGTAPRLEPTVRTHHGG